MYIWTDENKVVLRHPETSSRAKPGNIVLCVTAVMITGSLYLFAPGTAAYLQFWR